MKTFTIDAADVDGDGQAEELPVYFYFFYLQSIHSSTSVSLNTPRCWMMSLLLGY